MLLNIAIPLGTQAGHSGVQAPSSPTVPRLETTVTLQADALRAWIGRSETVHDTITTAPVAALTATLDHPAADTPTGTPQPIITKLHAESVKALQAPDLRDRMVAEGAEFVGDTPAQFTAYIRSELDKWGKAVKASGAKVD